MTNRFVKRTAAFLRTYPLWIFSLLVVSLFLRLYEHYGMAFQLPATNTGYTFLSGWLNDTGFALSFCFFLFPFVFLFWWWKPGAALVFFTAAGSVFILIAGALSRYYLTTKTLLGTDLFGYSLTDIKTTVSSSTSFAAADVLPLLLLAFFVAFLQWMRKRSLQLPSWLTVGLLTTGFICTFFFNGFAGQKSTPSELLSLNKCAYFLTTNLVAQKQSGVTYQFEGYPLLRADSSTDALSPYFNLQGEKPNIVFLIVEGLGRDFTGPLASYGGFTPFLDSLSGQGLYWTNFLSSAGRSFEGLPSILASLPYGQNGFSEMGQSMPAHLSLISLLKRNGYRTHFFYGGNANFDYQDVFLERQGIDFMLDENKFGPGYNRNFGSKYSWGYADGDVYKRSLEVLAGGPAQPLLNIYFTLSTHEPFAVPGEPFYEQKINAQLDKLPPSEQERYAPYKDVWKGLLYSDESIRSFFSAYAKRADFANTIFIITGDHRLIPVQEQNALSRYHVPLLIYSPLLKHSAKFPALSSHLDIVPSLVQLLRHHPDMNFPSQVHWMGKGLDTAKTFHEGYEMPFMRNKNQMEDYVLGNTFLAGKQLYRIKNNLQLEPFTNQTIQLRLEAKLDSFRQLNQYVCSQNKLLKSSSEFAPAAGNTNLFSPLEKKQIDSLSGGFKEPDTLFARARRLAFTGMYPPARLLCRRILEDSPNYHDVRVLYGRTYAWEKNFVLAMPAFAEVIRRNPSFEDAYLAWIDAETWAGKKDSALLLAEKALHVLPGSKPLKEKQVKLLASK